MVGNKCANPCSHRGINDREKRPFPTARFPFNGSYHGNTGEIEQDKHQKRQGYRLIENRLPDFGP